MNFSTLSVSFFVHKSLWIILKISSNQIKAKTQLFICDKDFVSAVNCLSAPSLPFIACCAKMNWGKKHASFAS